MYTLSVEDADELLLLHGGIPVGLVQIRSTVSLFGYVELVVVG